MRSEDTILIFHLWRYWCGHGYQHNYPITIERLIWNFIHKMALRCEDSRVTSDILNEMPNFHIDIWPFSITNQCSSPYLKHESEKTIGYLGESPNRQTVLNNYNDIKWVSWASSELYSSYRIFTSLKMLPRKVHVKLHLLLVIERFSNAMTLLLWFWFYCSWFSYWLLLLLLIALWKWGNASMNSIGSQVTQEMVPIVSLRFWLAL